MDCIMETIEYKGIEIEIDYDECLMNPRKDWDNLGTIVYNHSRYNLGDEEIGDPIEWLEGKGG